MTSPSKSGWTVAYDPQKTIPELSQRVVVLGRRGRLRRMPKVFESKQAVELLSGLALLDRESFCAIPVKADGSIAGIYVAHLGGSSATFVDPSVVARLVLICDCPSVIVSHNHPGGEAHPSAEDVALTERLATGLSVLDIQLMDHIIVARAGHFSFRQAGML